MKLNIKNSRNYILLGVCGVLAIGSVILTIEVATSGAQIANLQSKELVLSDQKRQLEQELVKTISLGQLQEKSNELGFSKPTDTVYLSQVAPVANIP